MGSPECGGTARQQAPQTQATMGWEVQSLLSIGPDHGHQPIHPPQPRTDAVGAGLAAEQLLMPFSALPLECSGSGHHHPVWALRCLTVTPARSASKMQLGTWVQIPALAPASCVLLGKLLSPRTCAAATSQGCCGIL